MGSPNFDYMGETYYCKAFGSVFMLSSERHLGSRTNSQDITPETVPAGVGWFTDSEVVKALIQEGAKIRIKKGHPIKDEGTFLHPHQPEIENSTRVILSAPGKFRIAGRRLAELALTHVTVGDSDDPFCTIHLTVFGPHRKAFHRERLFDGNVQSTTEALAIMNEHFKKG